MAPFDRPRRSVVALALIVVVAAAAWMRWWPDFSWAAGRTFERHDEVHYFPLALRFLYGRFDVHYFINPTFYAYVLAAVTGLVGLVRSWVGAEASFDAFLAREIAAPFFVLLSGRLLSIAASTVSVLVAFRVGRRLFSPAVGVIAGLLLALDGVASSRAPLCGNESLMVLLVLLAVDVAVGGASLRRRLASGLLLGLATATKYSAGILILPLLVAFGPSVGPALLGAAAGFALGSPMALVNFGDFRRGFATQAGFLHAGYGGMDVGRGQHGFVFYLRTFATTHHGVVLGLVCALGIVASIVRLIHRRERPHALLLAASVPLYVYLGTGIFHEQRFLLPALPFVLVHGAWALDRILDGTIRRAKLRIGADARLATALLIVVGLDASTILSHRARLQLEFGEPSQRQRLLAEVRPSLKADERVAEFAVRSENRLLIARDPWREIELESPSADVLAAVAAQLAARDLLPASTSLREFLARSPTLATLQADLRRERIDVLLVEVRSAELLSDAGVRPAAQDSDLEACSYWSELFAWLATLPIRSVARSPDRQITSAVLELRTDRH